MKDNIRSALDVLQNYTDDKWRNPEWMFICPSLPTLHSSLGETP